MKDWPNWQRLGNRAIADGLFARSTGASAAGNTLAKVWREREVSKMDARELADGVPQSLLEEQYLDGLKTFLRAGYESSSPGVRSLTSFWEGKISFCILVAQQERKRREAMRAKREALKLQVLVERNGTTASPSSLRIRVSASPSRD